MAQVREVCLLPQHRLQHIFMPSHQHTPSAWKIVRCRRHLAATVPSMKHLLSSITQLASTQNSVFLCQYRGAPSRVHGFPRFRFLRLMAVILLMAVKIWAGS